MGPVSDVHAASERLALLLTGGGGRCRRLLAAAPGDGSPLARLASAGAAAALLTAARQALAERVPALLERVIAAGWRWLTPEDSEYPSLLGQVSDPPLGLFVRGELAPAPRVAVVGSRRPTAYGRQVATMLGEELARAGVVVLSGMARGVDGAAHRGALEVAAGVTWAVWGTGPDRVYPPEHGSLAEEIAGRGALLTEYPPGTPPRRHHFPERNRILAGLADAVVVVEAAARSGALVTARLAVDEGREVFAVPGSIFSELSVGPNALLRVGARPLLVPADVLDLLDLEAEVAVGPAPDTTSTLEGHLALGESVTADELAARAGVSVGDVLALLLELEVAGVVARSPDGRYSRRRAAGPRRIDGGSE